MEIVSNDLDSRVQNGTTLGLGLGLGLIPPLLRMGLERVVTFEYTPWDMAILKV